MSNRERLLALRATRELAHFSDAGLQNLLPFIDELCVAAGAQVAQEGRLCHEFVIVAAGLLETCRRGRPGQLGPGETLGWDAMRTRGVNDATVSAATPAHLLVMSHEQFRAVGAVAPNH